MKAVRAGDKKIIKQELDLEPSEIQGRLTIIHKKEENYSRLFLGKKIFIIGGGKAISKKEELCIIAKELGAEECKFVDTGNVRLVESVASKEENDNIFIFLATKNSHRSFYFFNGSKFLIIVNRIGSEFFRKEVIEGYKKIKSNMNYDAA